MKFAEVKQVKVGEMTFPIKITNRAMIEFEDMSGSSVASFEGTKKLIQFFYCTAKAGDKEFKYTFDEFLDKIDDYYEEVMVNFSKAITGNNAEEAKK